MTDAIETILAERNGTHGDYADHAAITQHLKAVMRSHVGWLRLNDMQAESLEMIAHKIGRILAGKPDFEDHWTDIAGYARLVSQRLAPPAIQLRIPAVDADKLTMALAKDLQEAVQERASAVETTEAAPAPEPKGRKVKDAPAPALETVARPEAAA